MCRQDGPSDVDVGLAQGMLDVPVSSAICFTEWLPDELLVMIFLKLPAETLWSGECEQVCRRWKELMKSAAINRRKRSGRWAGYDARAIEPRVLAGHESDVRVISVGKDGKVFSASHQAIMVWDSTAGCGDHGLQKLVSIPMGMNGQRVGVGALCVGLDGKIYCGSRDGKIRVWSGSDGEHVQTLEGHNGAVLSLAARVDDGRVYSGSWDSTIRVWSGDDGTYLQRLEGHTGSVLSLAVGQDGKVFSGSSDHSVRMWSGLDGALINTLVGHTGPVFAMAVGHNGKVYSGSADANIRVWSSADGKHLQTLEGHLDGVLTLAVGLDGNVYSGSFDTTIRVWSGMDGTHLYALPGHYHRVYTLAIMRDGTLLSGGGYTDVHMCEVKEVGEVKVW